MFHFVGYMTLNVGGQFIYSVERIYPSSIKEYYKDFKEKSDMYSVDVPVQLGATIPLDSYNRYLISFLGGAYARYYWVSSKNDSRTTIMARP